MTWKEYLIASPNKTHGLSNTKTYRIWNGIKQRCLNPNCSGYAKYSKVGMDPRWMRFDNFYKDMGLCPPGYSIERMDNSKGYFKSNCKWATRREQNLNRTPVTMLDMHGMSMCLMDWAKHLNICYESLIYWIKVKKIPLSEAVCKIKSKRGCRHRG